MNCKEIKDIILADYADGRCSAGAAEEIERHIGACAGCRAFRESVLAALKPLRSAGARAPSAALWPNIVNAIERGKREEATVRLADLLSWLRPSWVNAAAVAGVVVCTLFAGNLIARSILPQTPAAAMEVADTVELDVLNDLPDEQVAEVYRFIGG